MKKFIKGTFEIEKNVADLEAYEQKHKDGIDRMIDFANSFGIQYQCGTSDDNTYLCEYKIVSNTARMCNSLLAEFKSYLKDAYGKVPKVIWQAKGDQLW